MGWKKFKQHRALKNESGQALIEFVLGLMIVISFFFFYLKMAASFAVGNYIHYATFMSARAYMASAANEEIQRQNAETVMQKMVGTRFKGLFKAVDCDTGCAENTMGSVKGATVGKGPYAQENFDLNYWNQGVTYSYQAKLSLYPWSRDQESVTMKLVSESWLPREVSKDECVGRKAAIEQSLGSNGKNVKVEWDNGNEGC